MASVKLSQIPLFKRTGCGMKQRSPVFDNMIFGVELAAVIALYSSWIKGFCKIWRKRE